MNQYDVIQMLGEDALLLTRPDSWIEHSKQRVSQKLAQLIEELKVLNKVTQIKTKMQAKNLVAVKSIKRIGTVPNESIQIMPLPDAVKEAKCSNLDNHRDQVNVWKSDGYDVELAEQLRS